MIELKGRIKRQRLTGAVNIVPGSPGGGSSGDSMFTTVVTEIPENHIVSEIRMNWTTVLVEEVEE